MHHNDAPNLDPRTDITDLFAFQNPQDVTRSILILNVNPEAPTRAEAFDPQASYELKIDTDGDFEAEIAFHVLFTTLENGRQTATLYRATDMAARGTGPVGEVIIQDAPVSFTREAKIITTGPYRFYAGLRSEPFFADPDGFVDNMRWTGRDGWAGKNVFGIVLDVPNDAFGLQPQLGIWGRTMVMMHGTLTPVNQAGRPGNNVLRQGADTNRTPPAQQRECFFAQYVATFKTFGYSEAEATKLSLEWLPDILPYNYMSAAGYPNGRKLTDDIVDNLVEIMTQGKMKDDLVGPHTNYLAEFPYLGTPHEL
ncbi:MAG TPA: DUF4331 family protein [Anaerolineales bacterium]|nr:DUF4331 family protein [Anaerolineales bacterium]